MNQSASSTSRQGIGLPVAGFSLPLARNQELAANVTLEEVLAGRKGALVVFWSGICAHCVRYDEYFNSFAATHPDVGFAAIASRLNETQAQMRQAIEERSSVESARAELLKLAQRCEAARKPAPPAAVQRTATK